MVDVYLEYLGEGVCLVVIRGLQGTVNIEDLIYRRFKINPVSSSNGL